MDERLIDLHTHSTASDGSMAPADVVKHAKEHGISAIALSDHDTTDGVDEAMAAGRELGVEIIPAIEMSVVSENETHILGYFIDHKSPVIDEAMVKIRRVRRERFEDNCRALQALGFDVTLEEAMALAGGEILCRAHFARLLFNKGYVLSVKEAFEKYLGPGKAAHSNRQAITDREAIELIHKAGGIAVLAHLHQMKKSDEDTYSYLKELKAAGLDGIEGYYTEYSEEMGEKYRGMAKELSLILSGGTDFHGAMKPHIAMGRGLGNMAIPYSLLQGLKDYHAALKG